MKLEYHRGKNFGDAINPIIFNHFLPEHFNNDDSKVFLGIGSILGLIKPNANQKIIVFSSGYAAGSESTYGTPPIISSNYDIKCVRGPLTANLLGLDNNKAITDGAILLAAMPWNKLNKKWETSYIPHVGSLDFYDWESLCNKLKINFIDPRKDPLNVISDIRSSNKVITEAMHGAILADTFRIPWVSIKAYPTVNEFKWQDWCKSMELDYIPIYLPSLYNSSKTIEILQNKFPSIPFTIVKLTNIIYQKVQTHIKVKKIKKILSNSRNLKFTLSKTNIFQSKLKQMLSYIEQLKS